MPKGIYIRTEQTKEKIRQSRIGKLHSEETKKKIGLAKEGKKQSKETIEKRINSRRNNGKEWHGQETRKKISQANSGEKNGSWKGDKAKKEAIHLWVKRRKPKPEFCEKCHKYPPYDLSNISGKYKRDVNDFEWLCRSCHEKKDWIENRKRDNGKFVK